LSDQQRQIVVRMPGMSSLEVQQELNRRAIDVPII
jgi:FixJ family two-component response regulator